MTCSGPPSYHESASMCKTVVIHVIIKKSCTKVALIAETLHPPRPAKEGADKVV
jgi:hypothetical protein